ncbi:MAG: YicC family protein [Gammaproteobacteria bacterium]|nr:YicC family protein [Gammaproteobacteria bacterium]
MIRSMTAFARREKQGTWGRLVWEIRAVNHRYLEMVTRLPEEFRVLEPNIKAEVAEKLNRGKIECSLRYLSSTEIGADISFNEEFVNKLVRTSQQINGLLGNSAPINALDILRWPGVMVGAESEIESVREQTMDLLASTLDELIEMRQREGEKIKSMIEQRCSGVKATVKQVRALVPDIIIGRRERLTNRLLELKAEVDQSRVEQELVIQVQKLDVDEELDRLDAHLEEVLRLVHSKEPVGRRLDFLMQELNREANTLGSKSIDVNTTRASVDLKVFIEQMREQIQNIE